MEKTFQKRNKYNGIALKSLNERYGYTYDFIRKSLRGDRTSSSSEKIIKEYQLLLTQINSVVNNFKNRR